MTQQRDKFSRREIDRSFRKFSDLVKDLMTAKYQTWGDIFSRLISHCETDSVMQIITEPLKTDPRIDADKWWTDLANSARGMIGSRQYSLPADDDERSALLYQVFLKLEHEDVDIKKFCINVYGHTNFQDMVNTFNHELVYKFTREISYRLDEIAADTAGQQEISRKAMVVFHHHDYSTNFSGNIQGSNIATGNSQISESTAQFNTLDDVAAELRNLKSLASDFSTANQATVTKALEFLATAVESGNAEAEDIAENVQTVSELSSTIASRLKSILKGAGTSLLGSTILEGIKMYFGIT